jgi:hypothetical protein
MTAPAPLRCAGCNRPGEPPRIWHRPEDRPAVTLTPVFGWGAPPRTVLLCQDCRAKLRRRRRKGKHS